MNWSHFQLAIYEAFERSGDSLLIEAVAGSGKTTVLVELARIMQAAFPEQRAVFVAFNRSIADELGRRIQARNVRAMTLHSAGWSAWRRAGGIEWTPRLDTNKTSSIMREVMTYEERKRFGGTTAKLVGVAKGIGLVPGDCDISVDIGGIRCQGLVDDDAAEWEALMDHYGMDEAECSVEYARKVLARGIEIAREACDYDDMLYMSVISGVPFDRYDVVLVDEAQDVSGIQMEMISRMVAPGGRIIAVGDRAQSIYGFRGAGTESMDIFQHRFGMTELPLSVSYRCPQAVVQHARQWVPQVEWAEGARDGYVGLEGTDWAGQGEIALGASIDYLEGGDAVAGFVSASANIAHDQPVVGDGISKWRGIQDFQPGDAVLCRLTRPLVAAAFMMIRKRIACRVLGRDIGKGIVDLICKAKLPADYPAGDAVTWLNDVWAPKERERLRNKQRWAQLGLLNDKLETIEVFYDQLPKFYRGDPELCPTVRDLIASVEGLFGDPNGGAGGMVVLSTIHKFKGCEASRVFVLDSGELMPCPWSRGHGWEMQQEYNLMYVAATRAKRELRYITTADLGGSYE